MESRYDGEAVSAASIFGGRKEGRRQEAAPVMAEKQQSRQGTKVDDGKQQGRWKRSSAAMEFTVDSQAMEARVDSKAMDIQETNMEQREKRSRDVQITPKLKKPLV
ncbi:hypothetical protein L2E82_49439 [Cichorium intybus]|uniref:Uncharacterized protein n=2 Tax=Cichorium intybus TaxID=13427 RepID=A0ACB8Z0N7_CICIN|nr:hypothetical protein L2E82_49435 [Cichorium intybus]KAI3691219.1 hypothetical protein L2E82_49439 [Cichorium intybus]